MSGSLLASVLHAVVDAVWYMPACMVATTLLAACAVRMAQFGRGHKMPAKRWSLPFAWHLAGSRLRLGALVVLLGLVGAWMLNQRGRAALVAPHWMAYLRQYHADQDARASMPESVVIEHLDRILYWNPDDSHAHLQRALACLAQFERLRQKSLQDLTVEQEIAPSRSAAPASDSQANSTMTAAVSEHLTTAFFHARRAVEICPLEGVAYAYLADISALTGGADRAQYVQQALLVRPFDTRVLLTAGNQQSSVGDLTSAFRHWQTVFQTDNAERARLLELLAAKRIPPQLVIEQFHPDLDTVRLLDAKYRPLLSPDEMEPLLRYHLAGGRAAALALGEEAASPLWAELTGVYQRLGNSEQAIRCLRRAAARAPQRLRLAGQSRHRTVPTAGIQRGRNAPQMVLAATPRGRAFASIPHYRPPTGRGLDSSSTSSPNRPLGHLAKLPPFRLLAGETGVFRLDFAAVL